jgi:DNA-binding HxlR family transcriptional regulator
MAEQENGSSPRAEALARVGDRWTLLVVEALLGRPQRFKDLLGQIPRDRREHPLRAPQAAGAGKGC